MPDPKTPARRRREARSDHTNVKTLVATARARGDYEGALAALEARINEMADDNFDQREEIRDLTEKNTALAAAAGKAPEGKVLIDAEVWKKAEAAQKALTTLNVDATTIVTQYPLGQKALIEQSASTVAKAEGLSDAGAKALVRLVVDHKLTIQTATKKVDDKDVPYGVALVDGKPVALRDHLKTAFAEYEPVIYAGATASGTTASHKPADGTRRMPATGATRGATRQAATDTKDAAGDVQRATSSVLSRYRPAEKSGAAT